jgi:predicted nuclease with TOPRIM domain
MEEQQVYIDISKNLQAEHEEIKREMLQILDATKVLEEQYNNLQSRMYDVEQKYVDNLKNIIK